MTRRASRVKDTFVIAALIVGAIVGFSSAMRSLRREAPPREFARVCVQAALDEVMPSDDSADAQHHRQIARLCRDEARRRRGHRRV